MLLRNIGVLHFMSCIPYHGTLLWERLERVAGYEPCCFDIVLCIKLQQTANTHGAGKQPLPLELARLFVNGIGLGIPREISLVESSPPYEPSQPATASMSTEIQQRAPDLVN